MLAPYLASPFVNRFKPENQSQFKLNKDHYSIGMNVFSINTSIPVTQNSKMLIFRDSNRSFKLDGDLLEMTTYCDFNVDVSNPHDRKLIYEFAKEEKFNTKQKGPKSSRDEPILRLLSSTAIMASGISTKLLPEKPNELCVRLKNITTRKTNWKRF